MRFFTQSLFSFHCRTQLIIASKEVSSIIWRKNLAKHQSFLWENNQALAQFFFSWLVDTTKRCVSEKKLPPMCLTPHKSFEIWPYDDGNNTSFERIFTFVKCLFFAPKDCLASHHEEVLMIWITILWQKWRWTPLCCSCVFVVKCVLPKDNFKVEWMTWLITKWFSWVCWRWPRA